MLLATPFRPTNVQKYLLRVPRAEVILYEKESLRWVMEPNVVTIGAQYSATDYTPDLAPPADIYRLICVTVFKWIGSMFTFTLFGINDSNCSFVTLARIYMLFGYSRRSFIVERSKENCATFLVEKNHQP